MNRDEANDFEFFFASGGGNLDFIAHLAIEKGAADGRSGGDEPLFDVGFLTADELVFDLNLALQVKYNYAGAIAGTIFRNVGEIEHAEVAHALFELADFGVDVTLALLGVFVLGVFGEVTVGAGDGDFLGELDVELVLESVDFLLQLVLNFRERISHSFATCIEKNDAEFGRAELRQRDIIRARERGGQGKGRAVGTILCKAGIISRLYEVGGH